MGRQLNISCIYPDMTEVLKAAHPHNDVQNDWERTVLLYGPPVAIKTEMWILDSFAHLLDGQHVWALKGIVTL